MHLSHINCSKLVGGNMIVFHDLWESKPLDPVMNVPFENLDKPCSDLES